MLGCQQIPGPIKLLKFKTNLLIEFMFNCLTNLDHKLGHLIIIINPRLLPLNQLHRQHPTQPLLIQYHLLFLIQLHKHGWNIIFIKYDA